jgi:hypothetical protein
VRPPPPRPAETVVTALGESATVPVEVIYVPSEALIENSPSPQPAMAAMLRFTRNNTNVRFRDTSRRPGRLLGGVDPANRRIPASRAG